jgi:hypothetical protein
MATASDTENFTNVALLFLQLANYHLFKLISKGIELLATSYQENGLQAESCQISLQFVR